MGSKDLQDMATGHRLFYTPDAHLTTILAQGFTQEMQDPNRKRKLLTESAQSI